MNTNINEQILWLNGRSYTPADIQLLRNDCRLLYGSDSFEAEVADFVCQWWDDNPEITVHTSGSTGTPKPMQVQKQRMMNSARLTLAYLKLLPGATALLAMPIRYIAGKMMVVRSLVGGLQLFTQAPSAHPLAHVQNSFDFIALTPMQVFSSLQIPHETELLRDCRQLIIGGGAIDTALLEQLQTFPHAVWSTYGMTETLSHIALRRLNGPEASPWYHVLPGIHISSSDQQTLVIDAPTLHPHPLITHDVVEWKSATEFRIIGRTDNIINSGGIKIQLEPLEAEVRQLYPYPFQLTAVPHPKWGEMLVLLHTPVNAENKKCLEHQLKTLPSYQQPKLLIEVATLPYTETQKPDRNTARQIATEYYLNMTDAAADHDSE